MIRPLTLQDRPQVDAVEVDADTRFDALSLPLQVPVAALPEHVFVEAVQDGLAFGVDRPTGLVGFVVGSVLGDAAVVEQLSVRTAAAGQGIGARLLDRFEQAARELGLSSVLLTTFAEVPWNAPYYASLDFELGAGSRGATLLSAETARGFDEDQRVAMHRVVRPDPSGWSTEVFETTEADAVTLALVRQLLVQAFGDDLTDDDWGHALGGLHAVVRMDGELVAHAAGVPRTLWIGASPWEAGYVEAVAVTPELQRQGLGTRVLRALVARLRSRYDLLALSSSNVPFYEGLGWRRWQGPTYVTRGDTLVRTEDEDGGIFVLDGLRPVPSTTGPIACDDRPGDVW